jgi:hypothetical protein
MTIVAAVAAFPVLSLLLMGLARAESRMNEAVTERRVG